MAARCTEHVRERKGATCALEATPQLSPSYFCFRRRMQSCSPQTPSPVLMRTRLPIQACPARSVPPWAASCSVWSRARPSTPPPCCCTRSWQQVGGDAARAAELVSRAAGCCVTTQHALLHHVLPLRARARHACSAGLILRNAGVKGSGLGANSDAAAQADCVPPCRQLRGWRGGRRTVLNCWKTKAVPIAMHGGATC